MSWSSSRHTPFGLQQGTDWLPYSSCLCSTSPRLHTININCIILLKTLTHINQAQCYLALLLLRRTSLFCHWLANIYSIFVSVGRPLGSCCFLCATVKLCIVRIQSMSVTDAPFYKAIKEVCQELIKINCEWRIEPFPIEFLSTRPHSQVIGKHILLAHICLLLISRCYVVLCSFL